jgi:hypothetical protein
MWGTGGPFPPAVAMVVAVVTPVVFCDKATENCNKNKKLVFGFNFLMYYYIL